MIFSATYRVGNGARGNVGADALVHVVAAPGVAGAIASVRNPLAAVGGAEPESLEDVRQRAPSAFRTQERAVTPADYAEVTGRNPEIQQAAATLRWTGSWRTVFITADRAGGAEVDAGFERELRRFIEPYRMAGQDLEVDAPRPVPLELTLRVCVKPDHFRGDVKAALLKIFSKRTLPDGRRGVFHPDNFTFGQPVYLSQIYAAAQAVDGVASADVTQFERQGRPDPQAFADGVLKFARLEIPRLDNDPNFPERGAFHLIMEGGK
jgi:predicted phage baseplate assembly protein